MYIKLENKCFLLIYLVTTEAAFIYCIRPQANSNVAAANIESVS